MRTGEKSCKLKIEAPLDMHSVAPNSQFSKSQFSESKDGLQTLPSSATSTKLILNSQLGCVATIGSFDGVHRGHQCLLRQVREIADERGMEAVAITFGTSPKKVLGMADAAQLTAPVEHTELLYQMGMDRVVLLDFTPIIAAMSARDFMTQVLKEQLQAAVLVIGYDHRFGHGRTEGFDEYVSYGRELGMEVVRGEVCTVDGEPVSSTRIRHLLNVGKVDEAASLLGYRYMLHGEVVDGYKEGRKMGFPTANICPTDTDKLIPADGVYAVYVYVDDNNNENRHSDENNSQFSILNSQFAYMGMLNIGHRPTMNNGKERSIEVHILDFEGDLYGQSLQIEFVKHLRDEQTFANIEELTAQLHKDKEQVKNLLTGIK